MAIEETTLPLSRVLPQIRVDEETYQFFKDKQLTERRRTLGDALRVALEDYAAEHGKRKVKKGA